jgi:hypothetical protein
MHLRNLTVSGVDNDSMICLAFGRMALTVKLLRAKVKARKLVGRLLQASRAKFTQVWTQMLAQEK